MNESTTIRKIIVLSKIDVELVDASVLVFSNTGLAYFVPEPPFP
jgi:hypothetical protein